MATSGTRTRAERAAFERLIDYAGLFPPAGLSMAQALAGYASAAAGPHRWILGRYIVPASRLSDLLDAFAAASDRRPLEISAIVDAGNDARTWLRNVQSVLSLLADLHGRERRIAITALEVALPLRRSQRETYDASIGQYAAAVHQAGLRDVPSFVEMPRDAAWDALLPSTAFALARHRLHAKVRCGGTIPEAFPSSGELAGFLWAMTAEQVAFKATAGLHHPLRRHDAATGFRMHGFLNVLAATAQARTGASSAQLQTTLDAESSGAGRFDEEGWRFGNDLIAVDRLEDARRHGFLSYGSCSFTEPIADLAALGALHA